MKQIVGLITAVILTFGSITAFSETNDTGNFNCNAGENLYTDKLSDVDAPVPYADYGGELLTGTVKEIYEHLKSYSREIACGERTVTDNLLIECSNAISEDDINTAKDTLWIDAPELLYWREPYGWNGSNSSTSSYGKKVTLKINVNSDYSASKEFGTFEVDPIMINSARKALENAKVIAAKYNNLSDYEKILAYANEMLWLTDSTDSTVYVCDELIDVFDDGIISAFNIRGYAKAFQYLCDIGGVECYTVSTSNDYVLGNMWNIVILDGISYHIDVRAASSITSEHRSNHYFILKGATQCDGKSVRFDVDVPWCGTNLEAEYTYSEKTLSLYPQNILKVSTKDYELPKSGTIKVNIKTLDSGAPDTSGLNVIVSGSGENKSVELANGLFDVSELADGAYTFTFSAKNCVPGAYDVRIENGKAKGLSSVELNLLGDVDGSGSIKMQDVILAFRATRNSGELTLYQIAVADANKDGSAKMSDVRAIYNHTRGESLWG